MLKNSIKCQVEFMCIDAFPHRFDHYLSFLEQIHDIKENAFF